MELPSARELELEVLLRERDAQLTELTDELAHLRQYLAKQPGPSSSGEAVTLPPPLLAVLLPHITQAQNATSALGMGTGASAGVGSSTVAAGITQRMRQLQQENDEMYALLTQSETGKLKDEARSLRRAVAKLEGALNESHKAIVSLSTELDKAHETIMSTSRHAPSVKAHSRSPRNSYHPQLPPAYLDGTGNGVNTNANSNSNSNSSSSKLPPTGPRAHKRPRLSEPQASPPPRTISSLPQKPQTHYHNNHNHSGHNHPHSGAASRGGADGREHSTSRQPVDNRSSGGSANAHPKGSQSQSQKMDVDDDRARAASPFLSRSHSQSRPPRDRERDRTRDRERERERERERNNKEREQRDRSIKERGGGREWDRDGGSGAGGGAGKGGASNGGSRRNGGHSGGGGGGRGSGGGGGGGGRRVNDRSNASSNSTSNANANHHENASRTLQERLGPMRPV